jgi:RNA polymerase sigma factor (sigma-70 family)
MKITDPGTDTVEAATAGDLAALDRVLASIEPGVFNLAARMLGNRDDAADATQEILLRVVTHLSSYRGEAAFTTWVWRVARNHLLDARTRSAESPEVSLEGMASKLQSGLELADQLNQAQGGAMPLTPQDKLEARQVALGCTQAMLMTLDREQRLAYLLETVFGLPSKEAAQVMDISPMAYRQRLSRARAKLDGFASTTCGLANPDAACRCDKQLPAIRHIQTSGTARPPGLLARSRTELADAERAFGAFTRVVDAAALLRAHPDYRSPEALRGAIRAVLRHEGWVDKGALQ